MTDVKNSKENTAPNDVKPDALMTPETGAEELGKGRGGIMRHLIGLLATAVIIGAVFLMLPLSEEQNPQDVIKKAWVAVKSNNFSGFQEVLDTSAFIQSLMEQAVTYEQVLEAQKPAPIEEVRRVMSQGLIGTFRNDLANIYTQQLEELVETGALSTQQEKGLMAQLWAETGAQQKAFKRLELIDQHDRHALVNLIFQRADLEGKILHLNLLLEKPLAAPQAGWVITGVPNLASFLFNIEQKRADILTTLNTPIKAQLQKVISFIDVQKSTGLDAQKPSVLWRIAYLNNSGKDIGSFKLKLSIRDAQGQLLKTQTFTENDPLASTATAEKVWPMALSSANQADVHVLENDLRTLNLNIQVVHVMFTDGSTLEVLKQLPTQSDQAN